MSITGITSNSSALQAQTITDKSAEVTGKDEFLQLLATQLQNQDPLDPMDNNQFLSQMAQFSALEQLINIRTTLEGMTTFESNTPAED